MSKNIIKNQVTFLNWTDKDFFHPFDGEMYSFKAGESVTLPNDVARHFAKHLANRETYRDNQDKEDNIQWQKFFDKCFPSTKPTPAVDIKLEDAEVSRVRSGGMPSGTQSASSDVPAVKPIAPATTDDQYKL